MAEKRLWAHNVVCVLSRGRVRYQCRCGWQSDWFDRTTAETLELAKAHTGTQGGWRKEEA